MTRCEVSAAYLPHLRWCQMYPIFGRCEFSAADDTCAPRPAACGWMFESCWEVERG